MTPRLLRNGLTGRVFVVTRYNVKGDQIEATTKYDVTDDFDRLVPSEPEPPAPDKERLRADIEAELALLTGDKDPFEAGAAAAYHFVLSRLATPAPKEPDRE